MAEFWPRDLWPSSIVPHPSIFRRFWCWLTGGHDWHISYWTGMEQSRLTGCTWPCHEYCALCWRFRDKKEKGDDA